MDKIELYYVESDYGCGIREAYSLEQAWKNLKEEEGTNHARKVRKATKEDIAWVEAMGGYIPKCK